MRSKLNFKIAIFLFFSLFFNIYSMETGYPKWDGLTELKRIGLPTPNATFIFPKTSEEDINSSIKFFLETTKTNLISLRSDGINGIGYSPNGITCDKNNISFILNKIKEWSSCGYGVTIIETHSRFDYDFCCNVLFLDNDGNFKIEFVGPGFDGIILNKSLGKPTIEITNKENSSIFIYAEPISGEANIETLNSLIFRVNINARPITDGEVDSRLEYIGSNILPDMGIKIKNNIEFVKKWLIENNYTKLLKNKETNYISYNDIKTILCYSSIYANYFKSKKEKIKAKAITFHKYNHKIICFGTFDGYKWGKIKRKKNI